VDVQVHEPWREVRAAEVGPAAERTDFDDAAVLERHSGAGNEPVRQNQRCVRENRYRHILPPG
jgi:hypothetical protein